MNLRYLAFIVLLLFLSSEVSSSAFSEYTGEFNELGEQCEFVSSFVYEDQVRSGWGWNTTLIRNPATYLCCRDNNCTPFFIDLANKELLAGTVLDEVIDLGYIRYMIEQHNLTTIEFIGQGERGVDSCEWHGESRLKHETVNLAVDIAEVAAKANQDYKYIKGGLQLLQLARGIGVVSPVNFANLGISWVCTLQGKELKMGLETLYNCNSLLYDINIGATKSGYAKAVNTCYDVARLHLRVYTANDLAQFKHNVDSSANYFSRLGSVIFYEEKDIDWLSKFMDALVFTNPPKTDYTRADEVAREIESKRLYFVHPQKVILTTGYQDRVDLKQIRYATKYNALAANIENISHLMPSQLDLFADNLLFDPNWGVSEEDVASAIQKMKGCRAIQTMQKFNSAQECLDETNITITSLKVKLNDELTTERHLDSWFVTLLSIIIVLLFVILKNQYVRFKRAKTRFYPQN